MNALYTTLIIALLSALIATILGTAAAIGIQAMRKKMRTVVTGVTNIPMLNADIVTGISLMLLFIACRFSLGFKTILIAHITFNIPYVILSVQPVLGKIDPHLSEAARDLGCTPVSAFFKVVLPSAVPGILSGVILSVGRIVGETAALIYTSGTVAGIPKDLMHSGRTLSVHMYALLSEGLYMEQAYATAVVLLVLVLIINMLSGIIAKKVSAKKG